MSALPNEPEKEPSPEMTAEEFVKAMNEHGRQAGHISLKLTEQEAACMALRELAERRGPLWPVTAEWLLVETVIGAINKVRWHAQPSGADPTPPG